MTSVPDSGTPRVGMRPGSSASGSADGVRRAAAGVAGDQSQAPAFDALLRELAAKAARLDARGAEVTDAEQLRGAVDSARATLDDALSLGASVLEAFRGTQHTLRASNADGTSSPGRAPDAPSPPHES